jgi:hypothetical protein
MGYYSTFKLYRKHRRLDTGMSTKILFGNCAAIFLIKQIGIIVVLWCEEQHDGFETFRAVCRYLLRRNEKPNLSFSQMLCTWSNLKGLLHQLTLERSPVGIFKSSSVGFIFKCSFKCSPTRVAKI